MSDKKALEKRSFYKEKISKVEKELIDEEIFGKLSLYELSEFSTALISLHEKFELKCLAVSYDADLSERECWNIENENAAIDKKYIKLKAKINQRIDELKRKEVECASIGIQEETIIETQEKVVVQKEATMNVQKQKPQIKNMWGVFNGKIEAFPQFYANFTTAMNKANYLRRKI